MEQNIYESFLQIGRNTYYDIELGDLYEDCKKTYVSTIEYKIQTAESNNKKLKTAGRIAR